MGSKRRPFKLEAAWISLATKAFMHVGHNLTPSLVPQLGDIRMVIWKIEVAHVEVSQVASQSAPQLHAGTFTINN